MALFGANKQKVEKRNLGEDTFETWRQYSVHPQRTEWINDARQNAEFYHSKQWSDEDIQKLSDRGQSDVVVNVLRPAARQTISQLTANLPVFNFVGVTDDDNKKSALFREVTADILRKNLFRAVMERTVRSMYIKGIGWIWIGYNPRANDGRGMIVLKNIPIEEVYVDPVTSDRMLQEARNIFHSKIIDGNLAIGMYATKENKLEEKIRKVFGSWTHIDYTDEELNKSKDSAEYQISLGVDKKNQEIPDEVDTGVRLIDRHTRTIVPVITVQESNGRFTEYYDEESYERGAKSVLDPQNAIVNELRLERIQNVTCIYDVVVETKILPTFYYPFAAFVYEDTENSWSQGEITYSKGMQEVINKLISLSLHNASVINSPRVFIPEGEYKQEDLDNMVKNLANSGSVNQIKVPVGRNMKDMIIVEGGTSISPDMLNMATMLKQDVQYEHGQFGISQGDPSQAPRTFSATLALKEWGNEKIRLTARSIDMGLNVVGWIILNYIQTYETVERVIRLTTDRTDAETNKKELEEQGLIDESGSFTINKPDKVDESGNVARYLNDTTVGEFDVAVVSESYFPTDRMGKVQLYMELRNNGIIDNQAVLEQLDIKDRDKILARTSTVQQQSDAIEGMIDRIKEQDSTIKSLREQVWRANMSAEMAQADSQFDKAITKESTDAQIKTNQLLTDMQLADERENKKVPENGSTKKKTDTSQKQTLNRR